MNCCRATLTQTRRQRHLLWFLGLVALSIIFIRAAAVDLEHYPPVSPDESWILSASFKLAAQGILGSDMFAGFFNADQHYLINPPVQHILQAFVFRLVGAGVGQARALSLAASLVLLWTVSILTWRWYGMGASLLAAVLMVFWRSNFSSSQPVVTLADLATSARYDVTLLVWAWLAILLLDRMLTRPHRLTGFVLGMCAGAAVLTQFFGVLVMLLVVSGWLWVRGKRAFREAYTGWIILGLAVVLAPNVIYIARYRDDFAGQESLNAFRTHFGSAAFYLDNLRREPDRFNRLLPPFPPVLSGAASPTRPFSPWLLVLGVLPALLWLAACARRPSETASRLLGLCLVVFDLGIALVDMIKLPMYGYLLYPALYILLAGFWASLLRRAWQSPAPRWLALSATTFSLVLLGVILLEGRRAYRVQAENASHVTAYRAVGSQIESVIEHGATLIGPERWWWALHTHDYRVTWWSIWFLHKPEEDQSERMLDQLASTQPDYILIDPLNREADYFPAWMSRQYDHIINDCTVPVAHWTDATYGPISLFHVSKSDSGEVACLP